MKNQNNNTMNNNTNNDLDEINNPYDLNKGKFSRYLLESELRKKLAFMISNYIKSVNETILEYRDLSFCFISQEYEKLDSLSSKKRNIKLKKLEEHLDNQLKIIDLICLQSEELVEHILKTATNLNKD